jgi:PAS domain S-box-containing protein
VFERKDEIPFQEIIVMTIEPLTHELPPVADSENSTLPHLNAPSLAGSNALNEINQRLFETSLDLILVVDRKGKYLRVSPSSLNIIGYAPEEIVGRSGAGIVDPDDLDNVREEMRAARRGREVRHFRCHYRHKAGRSVPLDWTGVWSEVEQRHYFIGRDMSERQKLESQLRHAQKMEAVGRLTGGIAHDFNNLLTVIHGAVELLTPQLRNDEMLFPLLQAIDEAAERGAQLTQRMLAFARKQPLRSQVIDINEIVTRSAKLLQRTLGEDVAVKTSLDKDLWTAQADASQLEDAIFNLAVNARDAMPKGGHLVLETANVDIGPQAGIEFTDLAPGEYVALIVTDSGSGMPPEVIERAFEPFFTTKDVGRGTGLGLSMIYGFVKQSGGHIKIYSEIGHGTSIKLFLPRAGQRAQAMVHEESDSMVRAKPGERILVVEDSPSVRTIAVSMLDSLGYEVVQASDGRIALEILRGGDRFDLLFTDLVMPNGVSGQELARSARQQRAGLKVLYTSGYSETFLKERGDAGGDIRLLSKPYRKLKLAEAVRAVLDGK